MLYKVIRRSVILFALGLFINNGYDLQQFRIMGVLQRFGISYLGVSLIILLIPKLGNEDYDNEGEDRGTKLEATFRYLTRAIRPYIIEWVVVLLLLVLYLSLTFGLDVPNCGRGYLGPGGIGDFGIYNQNCTGGAARYIDITIFGEAHIYQTPTCIPLYHCCSHDPEGLLGCLTSIFLCYCGLQTGRIILYNKNHFSRIIRWFVWGVFLGLISLCLCEGKMNGGFIPLNKNLWSPSFILAMGGSGNIVLIVFYLLMDVFGWWDGGPFIFPGMNSILIYVGSETLNNRFPFSYDAPNTHAAQLTENLVAVSCWVALAYYMYLNDFFINI